MKVPIKATSDGVGYASKSDYEYEGKKYEADLQNRDTVKILNEGEWEEGQWGDRLMLKIETRNGEKKASVNQSSINVLAGEYGDDTANWMGKTVHVLLKKTIIANERRIVAYFVPEGWYLDDFGDLVKDEEPEPREATVTLKTENEQKVADIQAEDPGASPF